MGQKEDLMQGFDQLFKKAELTQKETEFFMEDAQEAHRLGYSSPVEYYQNKETQYCVIEYVRGEWKEIAKSGLSKILAVINVNEEYAAAWAQLKAAIQTIGNLDSTPEINEFYEANPEFLFDRIKGEDVSEICQVADSIISKLK